MPNRCRAATCGRCFAPDSPLPSARRWPSLTEKPRRRAAAAPSSRTHSLNWTTGGGSATSAAARLRLGLWLLWAGGVLAYYFAYVSRALFSRDVTLSFDIPRGRRHCAVRRRSDGSRRPSTPARHSPSRSRPDSDGPVLRPGRHGQAGTLVDGVQQDRACADAGRGSRIFLFSAKRLPGSPSGRSAPRWYVLARSVRARSFFTCSGCGPPHSSSIFCLRPAAGFSSSLSGRCFWREFASIGLRQWRCWSPPRVSPARPPDASLPTGKHRSETSREDAITTAAWLRVDRHRARVRGLSRRWLPKRNTMRSGIT